MGSSLVAVCVGASLGAMLRWVLALRLNTDEAAVPLGTLASNLLGGYLVGIAVAYFSLHADISPQVRLLVVTGFLGGLTTFSTFSAEVVTQLQQGRIVPAIAIMFVHLAGSLVLTALGIATVQWAAGK